MRSSFRLSLLSSMCVLLPAFVAGVPGYAQQPGAPAGQGLQVVAPAKPAPAGNLSVLTYHNDNLRTGQNTQETTLTLANVNSTSFGLTGFYQVDGKVDAQPLYVAGVKIQGNTYNVLYVVTEHDSIYALNADTGAVLWQSSALGPGETTSDARGCDQVVPEIGITSTPVIDPTATPHGVIYVVAMSKDSGGGYHQRLHALDLMNGAEVAHSPVEVQASYPSSGPQSVNGRVIFDPAQYKERAGLLLLNGTVYLAWSSHCDHGPYTGWVMGYDAKALTQTSVLNLTPNGQDGSVWQAGAGPAADANGNIYFLVANGTFDNALNAGGFPVNGDYGNAFMKLSTGGNRLAVADYFAMYNAEKESGADLDLGSGGAMVLPDARDGAGNLYHLAVGAGKDQNIYVVNRDNMGKWTATQNTMFTEFSGGLGGAEFAMPAYWNNFVYYGASGDVVRDFPLSGAPGTVTGHRYPYPGVTPGISSNGNSNGILWAIDEANPATLYAYDATNLNRELYDSNQAANGRDHFGPGNKFITPTIVNGKVFVGTATGVAVFGLLQ